MPLPRVRAVVDQVRRLAERLRTTSLEFAPPHPKVEMLQTVGASLEEAGRRVGGHTQRAEVSLAVRWVDQSDVPRRDGLDLTVMLELLLEWAVARVGRHGCIVVDVDEAVVGTEAPKVEADGALGGE